jgi:type VI protein secretion system component Hcp
VNVVLSDGSVRFSANTATGGANDGDDSSVLAVELENLLVSSYQVTGGENAPMESYSLNFTKIGYKTVPLN